MRDHSINDDEVRVSSFILPPKRCSVAGGGGAADAVLGRHGCCGLVLAGWTTQIRLWWRRVSAPAAAASAATIPPRPPLPSRRRRACRYHNRSNHIPLYQNTSAKPQSTTNRTLNPPLDATTYFFSDAIRP